MSSTTTIAQRLAQVNFRPSGFDYMRLVLAAGVIYAHAMLLTGTKTPWHATVNSAQGILITLIVPMFFALSGFLVAGSLERTRTLVSFLGLRVFRIMPALNVEVILSAVILGSLFTTLPLREYFAHAQFYNYFWNMLGHVQYHLPGVYEANPLTSVNGQMWTVPYELVCYVILSVLAITGVFKNRRWLLAFMALYYAAQIANTVLRPNPGYGGAGGSTVVMAFVAGLLIYRYRDKLSWSLGMATAASGLTVSLICFVPNGIRFTALPLAYVTAYLGLLNPPRNGTVLSGDYSYGMYLYAYPIQQAVVALFPEHRNWYFNFAVSLPLAVAFACFSWWCVEKPVMDRKGVLRDLEDWYIKNVRVGRLRPQ
ncbi:acyltransferase [uncultured Aquabacterium sp.]|uniref:acyltransferase family protein n=1 Tax=uncultured Aquabacterium sp. TaxID=158753 RepID=UPI0025FFBBB3|nr:acyltransferase [uncultured Aquabacterium sp.]